MKADTDAGECWDPYFLCLFFPDFLGDLMEASLLGVTDLIADATGLPSAAMDDTVENASESPATSLIDAAFASLPRGVAVLVALRINHPHQQLRQDDAAQHTAKRHHRQSLCPVSELPHHSFHCGGVIITTRACIHWCLH